MINHDHEIVKKEFPSFDEACDYISQDSFSLSWTKLNRSEERSYCILKKYGCLFEKCSATLKVVKCNQKFLVLGCITHTHSNDPRPVIKCSLCLASFKLVSSLKKHSEKPCICKASHEHKLIHEEFQTIEDSEAFMHSMQLDCEFFVSSCVNRDNKDSYIKKCKYMTCKHSKNFKITCESFMKLMVCEDKVVLSGCVSHQHDSAQQFACERCSRTFLSIKAFETHKQNECICSHEHQHMFKSLKFSSMGEVENFLLENEYDTFLSIERVNKEHQNNEHANHILKVLKCKIAGKSPGNCPAFLKVCNSGEFFFVFGCLTHNHEVQIGDLTVSKKVSENIFTLLRAGISVKTIMVSEKYFSVSQTFIQKCQIKNLENSMINAILKSSLQVHFLSSRKSIFAISQVTEDLSPNRIFIISGSKSHF